MASRIAVSPAQSASNVITLGNRVRAGWAGKRGGATSGSIIGLETAGSGMTDTITLGLGVATAADP